MPKKYTFLAFTNPAPGKEDEYNAWYEEHHLKDVINCPGFVSARRFRLAPAPVASITSLVVDGTTIASGNYRLDGSDLVVKGDVTDSTNELGGGIVITFVTGYGAAGSNVPDGLIEAILMLGAEAYERRGESGDMLTPIPDGVIQRLAQFRVMREF